MKARLLFAAFLIALLYAGAVWPRPNPDAVDLARRFAPMSWQHVLGTDNLGRDVMARLTVGAWRTATVILSVGAIGFFGGSLAGTAAALLGGWAEAALLRSAELFIVVPTLIVALVAAAVFGLSPQSAGLALGLANLGPYTLMAHTLTRSTLGETYVDAACALGVPGHVLLVRHVLPATLPVLLTYAGSQAGASAIAYAALSFIGLGADPSQPDWGGMLFDYRLFVFDHPTLVLWPGLALAGAATALNLTFDARR